jgi:hypothetical protein
MQVTGSTKLFNELVMYAGQNKITGGFFFQYADVWWKFGSPNEQDTHGWAAGGFPDKFANEEWWGVFKISPGSPNVLTPRKMFDALSTLHKNAQPYGYIESYIDKDTEEPLPDPSSVPTIKPYVPTSSGSTSSSSLTGVQKGLIAGGAIIGAFVLYAGFVSLKNRREAAKKAATEGEKNEQVAKEGEQTGVNVPESNAKAEA